MPKITTKRRFEFVGGRNDKFWEVRVAGNEVTVRFGRNGTVGQSTIKKFADEEAAQKHADKLAQQKLSKGYREIR